MSLTKVKVSEEVWQTCLTHALSTETEEIMGLLLGDIETSSSGDVTALIWGASPQTRSDRRKDRVETNPEQLAAASSQAESMTLLTGRTTRVIGWYHSHPHITVLPSHVDVRTQAMYQLLDSGFIGLIFSCFSEDAQKVGRIQVIAFQSLNGKQKNVSPSVQIISSPHSETRSMLSVSEGTLTEVHYQDTGDSGALKGQGRPSELQQFFTHADANSSQKEKKREHSTTLALPYYTDKTQSLASDEDSTDLSSGMQEAMYRSNMDVSGAEYVRKEIPLYVVPCQSLVKLAHPLSAFIKMQRVLFEEEQAAYQQAIMQNMQDGKVHPLDVMHHSSAYISSMCKLIEYCLSPALNAMQKGYQEDEIRLAMLKEEAKLLEAELSRKGSESHLVSPVSPQKVARHEPRGGSSSGMKGSYPVYPEKKDLHPSPEIGSDAVKPVKDIKFYYSRSKGNRGARNMG